jgi:hypothetical protein
MRPASIIATFCLAFLLSSMSTATCQLSTTFDTDLEGWTVTGDNSAAWEDTTGIPEDVCL